VEDVARPIDRVAVGHATRAARAVVQAARHAAKAIASAGRAHAYLTVGIGAPPRARYPRVRPVCSPCIDRETPSTPCSITLSPSTWRPSCARLRRRATASDCRRSWSGSSGSSCRVVCSTEGVARFRCESCAREHLVPFSCKGRGFCPSCGGRRMTERAAHLVDTVLPRVPLRQWVLTVPYRLRYRMAFATGSGGCWYTGAWSPRTIRPVRRTGSPRSRRWWRDRECFRSRARGVGPTRRSAGAAFRTDARRGGRDGARTAAGAPRGVRSARQCVGVGQRPRRAGALVPVCAATAVRAGAAAPSARRSRRSRAEDRVARRDARASV
jgi:transposase-like zinc-binding protein